MKNTFLMLLGLLLLLTGCNRAPAESGQAAAPKPAVTVTVKAQTAAPTDLPLVEVTPIPTGSERMDQEPILGYCISILDRLPFRADLDGDGAAETVDLTTLPGAADGCPRWTVSVQKGDNVKLFETDVLSDMPCDLWAGDLDEDGRYELFFHGDLASDDYIIYAWRDDLSLLFFEPDDRFLRWNEQEGESSVFAGYIEGFEDGHIIVSGAVDMLGTHWGVRTLAMGDDGVIGPVSSAWEFEEDDERFLTVKRELPAFEARVRKDPGDAFTLQPGEKLYPLASDGCERMWFKTDDGKTGVLLLVPDEDPLIQWRIDGTPEADYFEFLPYSG